MTIAETNEAIAFLTQEAKDLIRSKLQSVIDGEYILYNTISEEYPTVTDDRIDDIVELFIEQLNCSYGHGIEHLIFIKQQEQSQ
jgi:ABC-type transporter MlaC component